MRGKMSDYWKGYVDAIRHADTQLQCRSDDRSTRYCRRDVLKLAGVTFDPAHAVPIPEWPPEDEWIAAQPQSR